MTSSDCSINFQAILSSKSSVDKSAEYRFLRPWLGLGLLTSNGSLWKSRRRMLTPAFHFKILEDFAPVMNEQSNILVNNLRKVCDKSFIDIREPIVQCTLDVICGMFCLNNIYIDKTRDKQGRVVKPKPPPCCPNFRKPPITGTPLCRQTFSVFWVIFRKISGTFGFNHD